MARPFDYDANPARYRLGMRVSGSSMDPTVTPLHARIWAMAPDRADLVVADVGCADGPLAAARPEGRAGRVVGIDRPTPSTFDAEDAVALVSQVFGHVETEWWDALLVTLRNRGAIAGYLVARWVPRPRAAAAGPV